MLTGLAGTAALNFTLSSCLESKRGRGGVQSRIGTRDVRRVKSGLVISVTHSAQKLAREIFAKFRRIPLWQRHIKSIDRCLSG